MKDIFQNKEFNSYLYGGVHDLDEPLGRFIYNLYRAGIKTTWSCSGHIGPFLEDSGRAIEGNYTYSTGKLAFIDTSMTNELVKKLTQITQEYKFAKLTRDKNDPEFWFFLEMEDIAINSKIQKVLPYAKLQIPIKFAEQRYEQFLKIWKDLTIWSEENLAS